MENIAKMIEIMARGGGVGVDLQHCVTKTQRLKVSGVSQVV